MLGTLGAVLRGQGIPRARAAVARFRDRGRGTARDPEIIERLDTETVAHHYETVIRALDKPPIIIGHSLGGALTQIMLDRGLGIAGVAIDSVPVKG